KEERTALRFPPDWDLSEIGGGNSAESPGTFAGLAKSSGLEEDLEAAFSGQGNQAKEILAAANSLLARSGLVPGLPGLPETDPWENPGRMALAQRLETLERSLTEENLASFIALRRSRIAPGERTALTLHGIRFGGTCPYSRAEDQPAWPDAYVAVAWAGDSFAPLFSSTLPAFVPPPAASGLAAVGMASDSLAQEPCFVTREGYGAWEELADDIRIGRKIVAGASVSWKPVEERIRALGEDGKADSPAFAEIPGTGILAREFLLEEDDAPGISGLSAKLFLFCDPKLRREKAASLLHRVKAARNALKALPAEASEDLRKALFQSTADFGERLEEERIAIGFFAAVVTEPGIGAEDVLSLFRLERLGTKLVSGLGELRGQGMEEEAAAGPLPGRTFVLLAALALAAEALLEGKIPASGA
ncbi:MAG: hypothetical protein MR009_01225, partial [Sutterellaceae bacterium]|nr:hypothetical protein [Sutterellaceae bacterium]